MNREAATKKLHEIWKLAAGALDDLDPDEPDDPKFLNELVIMGNPALTQFPTNSEKHCFNRGVWDMYRYGDSIYVSGGGDTLSNAGPVQILQFQPGASPAIVNAYLCPEEQVARFRPGNMSMLVPGADRCGSYTGAIYELSHEGWHEYHTIPNAGHVTDAALLGDMYYVITDNSKLRRTKTPEDRESWQVMKRGDQDTRFGCLIEISAGLLMIGHDGIGSDGRNKPGMWFIGNGGVPAKMGCFPFPGPLEQRFHRPSRAVRYGEGALYISTLTLYAANYQTLNTIYHYAGGYVSSRVVEAVPDAPVYLRDIVVRGDTCFVLGMCEIVESGEPPFVGTVHKADSSALNFELIAEFEAPAMPYSLEELDRDLYVGFGSGLKGTGKPTAALAASGGIYKLVAS